jgi:hypothetical protein
VWLGVPKGWGYQETSFISGNGMGWPLRTNYHRKHQESQFSVKASRVGIQSTGVRLTLHRRFTSFIGRET